MRYLLMRMLFQPHLPYASSIIEPNSIFNCIICWSISPYLIFHTLPFNHVLDHESFGGGLQVHQLQTNLSTLLNSLKLGGYIIYLISTGLDVHHAIKSECGALDQLALMCQYRFIPPYYMHSSHSNFFEQTVRACT
jgi:hypothetical protein